MGILVSFEEDELFLFLRSMSRVQREAVCRALPRFWRYRHDAKDERVP